jgi:hypothetical protein
LKGFVDFPDGCVFGLVGMFPMYSLFEYLVVVNYNFILDGFFGNPWLCWGLLIAYFAFVLMKYRKHLTGKKPWKYWVVYVYVVPMVWVVMLGFLNPMVLGYGKPRDVVRLNSVGGNLYVTDFLLTSGGKSFSGSRCFRMHVIDPQTGERKRRFLIGNNGYVTSVHGDKLAFSHANSVDFYSITTGRVLNKWTVETLPKLFPQLASGVKSMEPYKADSEVTVSSLNGNKWVLSISHNSIAPYVEPKDNRHIPTGKIYLDGRYIRIDNEQLGTTLITLGNLKNSDQKQMICSRDTIINRHVVFLHGEIVALSVSDSCFVVRDYDNINRIGVDYTCMSLDGKRELWQIKERMLRPGDSKKEPIATSCCIDEPNHLFFVNMETEVIAVGMKDGKVVWRKTL